MYDRTNGDRCKRKCVSGPDINVLARYYLVAYLESLGSEDVGLLAVLILDQRDERGTVGIVLNCLYNCFYVKLITFEIYNTVLSSVAAASVTNCDSAVAVTARLLVERSKQALLGSNL